MKALILREFNTAPSLETVPDPACPPDGAVIDVKACGVCRSDLHAFHGVDPDVSLPHIMGHEFAGIVAETGPECRQFKVGDRVTAPFILACGHCPECRRGQAPICGNQLGLGFNHPGAFAQYVAIPHADANLIALPENLSFSAGAGMGCRMSTAWRALTERAALAPGEWLAVHGCGGVGLSAIQIAQAVGARAVAVDINPKALETARKLGAEVTINAASFSDVGEEIRNLTDGGCHVAIDALGITTTVLNALRSLRKQGRYVQIGMPVGQHAIVQLPLLELIYSREISLMGSRGIGAAQTGPLLALVESGQIRPEYLIEREITLSEAGASLLAMQENRLQGVRIVTRFDQ